MKITRKRAAEIAGDTLEVINQGYYLVGDRQIDIAESLKVAVDNTTSYPPEHKFPQIPRGSHKTAISVVNETTLSAAQKLTAKGYSVAALNFASAKNPGGGFRSGSLAQEESLARSSGLYDCLVNNEMYKFHRSRNDPMYSNYAIYSPNVPVFKYDDGTLLEKPYLCSFVTSPAVNVGAMAKSKQKHQQIQDAMRERIWKILAIAAIHKQDAYVLGAWGCGVFKNDSSDIAKLFQQVLQKDFQGTFREIVFAVTDWSQEQRFIGPFYKVFGHK